MSSKWSGLAETGPGRVGTAQLPAGGPIYRPAYAPDGPSKLGCETLLESFERSVLRHGDRPCLGQRKVVDGVALPFEFITYTEASKIITQIGSAYSHLGLKPKDKIGVIGPNSPEWMMAMQAMNRMDMVCVPLYDTLGEEAVEYIIKHSESKLVISAGSKLASLVKTLPKVKNLVTCGVAYWGAAPPETLKALQDQGISVLSWDQLKAKGEAKLVEPTTRPSPEDLCTIMYTSGTTGDPKGVSISHRAVLSTISGILDHMNNTWEQFGEEDVFLSYLPLAHIFDRVLEELFLYVGGSIGYFQGDIRRLVDDIQALKPTLFVGVPRVFERIYNGVVEQIKKGGSLTNLVYQWAYSRKLYYMQKGWRHDQASYISDLLVFNKIKQRLGGRVRVIVSGGAPLSPSIEEFLRVAMCCPVVQGYGLTETCAASFVACPFNIEHMGSVGPPISQTELRLEAVPEMGYSPDADPPSGEVCVRGPGVFTSYYKNEAMTKESIDAEGFFHTGDIGILTADGSLKIIDRKKNIFKLSHGEYIAVEKLETVYKHCPLVEQIWVYGNSMESTLVAVVVPAHSAAREWAQANGVAGDVEALCLNSAFNAHVVTQLRATGKAEKLKGFEDIKGVLLEPEQFTVENDLMTPKFSLKRNQLLKKYQSAITSMYQTIKANTPPAS